MTRTLAAFAIALAFAAPAFAGEGCYGSHGDKTASITPPAEATATPTPVAEAPILLPVVPPSTGADG